MSHEGLAKAMEKSCDDAQLRRDVDGLVERLLKEGISIDDISLGKRGEKLNEFINAVYAEVTKLLEGLPSSSSIEPSGPLEREHPGFKVLRTIVKNGKLIGPALSKMHFAEGTLNQAPTKTEVFTVRKSGTHPVARP